MLPIRTTMDLAQPAADTARFLFEGVGSATQYSLDKTEYIQARADRLSTM